MTTTRAMINLDNAQDRHKVIGCGCLSLAAYIVITFVVMVYVIIQLL